MMQDPQGRSVRYLRLSITRACGMHCAYCRPAGSGSMPDHASLTPAEMDALVRHLVARHGLRKVRLTGGEPTVRPDLLEIIARLSKIEGLQQLTMTTNGLTLARQAAALADAGLLRVNISLDSLNPDTFARITGVSGLTRVLAGIDAAISAGLTPVKLNTVVFRGANDHELPELIHFAAARGLEIRFIELMPMGPLAGQWSERFVSEKEMRVRLASEISQWSPIPHGASAARSFRVQLADGSVARIAFITAMSCPFCDQCDRIRVGADGSLYPCLMGQPNGNLMPALRPVFDGEHLEHILQSTITAKAPVHPAVGFNVMTHIGG